MWNISSPPPFPCPLLHSRTPAQTWILDSFCSQTQFFVHKKCTWNARKYSCRGCAQMPVRTHRGLQLLAQWHCLCWKNCWIVINFIYQVCTLICACEIHGKRNCSLLWALKSLIRFLRWLSLLVNRNADWKVGGGGKWRKNFACTAIQKMLSQNLK